eukprot:scaffold1035_cov115-Cylindrotheca_fusiformis.AAC.7
MTDEPLSKAKYGALVLAMMTSSLLSAGASIAVVRISVLKLQSTYQRFLFMLALANILNCMFLLWHPVLVPQEPMYYWSIGNDNTCIASGFFFIFGSLATSLWSTCLALYFFFSIRSNPKRPKMPEDVIGPAELTAHVVCWLCPIIIASAAAGTESISVDKKSDLCLPQKPCNDSINSACIDGMYSEGNVTLASEIIMIIHQAIIIVGSLIAIASTAFIYVRALALFHEGNRQAGEQSEPIRQRIQAVSRQSVLYTLAYLNSFLWLFVMLGVSGKADANTFYALQLLTFFLYPLQGLVNSVVYIRPRYQMLRVMYPQDPATVVLRVSLSTAGDPDEIEHVRATIFGDDYIPPPSIGSSSAASRASDLPDTIEFDTSGNVSVSSAVSTPEGNEGP